MLDHSKIISNINRAISVAKFKPMPTSVNFYKNIMGNDIISIKLECATLKDHAVFKNIVVRAIGRANVHHVNFSRKQDSTELCTIDHRFIIE